MATNNQFNLGPSDLLDFQWSWEDWLADNEIITSACVVPPFGITVFYKEFDDQTVTAWLSGSPGKYAVPCLIETNSGAAGVYRQEKRNIYLTVAER